VSVTLSWSPHTRAAAVADTGPAPGREAVAGQGTGLGLAGLTERVREAGGTVQAGPRAGGGWLVEIRVPSEGVVE
jgi:signal transduction histidine kinase